MVRYQQQKKLQKKKSTYPDEGGSDVCSHLGSAGVEEGVDSAEERCRDAGQEDQGEGALFVQRHLDPGEGVS